MIYDSILHFPAAAAADLIIIVRRGHFLSHKLTPGARPPEKEEQKPLSRVANEN